MSNPKPKTIVAIIMDKSGSMARTKAQAISGYNEEVQQLKENSKDQDIRVCLVTFNANVDEHLWLEPADKLTEASDADYVPGGGTSMYDAMGYTIQKLMDTTDYEDPNTAYLIRVISDGDSMSDSKYGLHGRPLPVLREMIDGCQATKRWTITYVGCTAAILDRVARETGISPSNMASWDNTRAESALRGARLTARKTGEYLSKRSLGVSQSMGFMNDDIGAVADYASDDSAKLESLDFRVGACAMNAGDVQADAALTPEALGAVKTLADLQKGTNIRYTVADSPARAGTVFAQAKRVNMVVGDKA